MMISQVSGFEPGELVHVIADAPHLRPAYPDHQRTDHKTDLRRAEGDAQSECEELL